MTLSARLHGMFFMAEPPPTPSFSTPTAFPELTCYRRNLFQVTGSITLPRRLRYILTDNGDRLPIMGQELQISATESVEGHPVKLICVPWKTALNNVPPAPEEKSEKEPTSIPLDIMSNQDMDADFATFPIAWKRLQFRIATANNGRRRELQQHFAVRIKLVATLSTGAKLPVAEARSNAVIVRGRSPRNFQQRKEQPVGGDKGLARKQNMQPPSTLSRRTTTDSSTKSPLKRERSSEENAFTTFDFNNLKDQPRSNTSSATPIPTNSTPTLPSSKSTTQSTSPPPASSAAPTTQSPVMADSSDFKRPPSQRPAKVARTSYNNTAVRAPPYRRPSPPSLSSTRDFLTNHSNNRVNSTGLDSADLLYEYFPLGVDDWVAPVDAVYRPHVVHHVPNAAGIGGAGPGGAAALKSRRYFSQDTSPAAPNVSNVSGTATTGAS